MALRRSDGLPCPVCGGDDRFYLTTRPKHGGDPFWTCRMCNYKEYDRDGQPSGIKYHGSGVTLAMAENPPVRLVAKASPIGYANLADYAQVQGSDRATFAAAGWDDALLYEYAYTNRDGDPATGLTPIEPMPFTRIRRALSIETDGATRYRLLDGDKPKYWHAYGSHTGVNKVWYRLPQAIALALATGQPLVLVNGEASVVVAQSYGMPAVCEAGGGEKQTPDHLMASLRQSWTGPVLIALDGDAAGRKASEAKHAQYQAAGFVVRAIDIGAGEDVATFCKLRQAQSMADLVQCPDLVFAQASFNTAPQPAPGATQAPVPGMPPGVQAIIGTLARVGYTKIRKNQCGDHIEINGEPRTDEWNAIMRGKLRELGFKKFDAVDDAIVACAAAQSYHPIKTYLDSLPAWDGIDRIGQLADCLHGDHPTVTYNDGTHAALHNIYLVRWLVGSVAKIYEQAQNVMLVLSGVQGRGKSQLARWLCPDSLRAQYFLEQSIDPHDKDSFIRLRQFWLWEVGELDATMRKSDISALKEFITKKIVTVRRSYGRYDTTGPAVASLIGTVNGDSFLADDTGNRRFYVIDVQSIDWGYTQICQEQFWSQVMAHYRAVCPWQLLPEENLAQTAHNRRYLNDGVWGDWLKRYLEVTNDPADTMTLADVFDMLRGKGIFVQQDRSAETNIGRAMAALGVARRRLSGSRCYVGVRVRP